MFYSDCHMHTSFSTDSDTPPREMIEGAIAKGMESICITDHMDGEYPFYEDFGKEAFVLEPEEYFKTLSGLREEYGDKIRFRIGIEIGLQPQLGEFYKELTGKYPFDFVIGSTHLVKGKDPYYKEEFSGVSDTELYRSYFETMLENLETNTDFDVLGHLDYVVRYGKQREKEYSYQKYAELIDEILKKAIHLGKGIELNTAGFKYGLPFCNPHPDIIKRYRELGGEIITVGADGHKPEHIGYAYEKVNDILKECGFKYYTEFEGRKAIFKQLL